MSPPSLNQYGSQSNCSLTNSAWMSTMASFDTARKEVKEITD
jgi:hypothetical protein